MCLSKLKTYLNEKGLKSKEVLLCFAVILGLWIGIIAIIYGLIHIPGITITKLGTLGDTFGVINAFVSALAFGGVLISLFMQNIDLELQHKDLKLQRGEMKRQREEMRLQREEFETQNETMKLQRFENTFFHMMELQQQIVNGLIIQSTDDAYSMDTSINEATPQKYTGRQVFECLYTHCWASIDNEFNGLQYCVEHNRLNAIKDDNKFAMSCLDHYFMHIYNILSYIDTNTELRTDKEKYLYAKMLRATLSRYELAILYYNGLIYYDLKLKPLLEKYCMLNNLNESLLGLSMDMKLEISRIYNIKVPPSTDGISAFKKWNGEINKLLQEYKIGAPDYSFFLTMDESPKDMKYSYRAFYHEDKKEEARKICQKVEILMHKSKTEKKKRQTK